ncbi:MAG: hypothetical protein JXR88_01900 [Clostridia bacterium]|nr:hypothetical protein [Clostridia bacterium]
MSEEKIYSLKLIKIISETDEIKTYLFEKPDFSWSEGTNIHVAFHDYKAYDKKLYVRHFSIMNLENESYLSFTTRLSDSPFKKRLKEMSIGDCLLIYKPSQKMKIRKENRPIVLISMGVGLAPMLPIIETFKNQPEGITSVMSIHISKDEYLFKSFFIDHPIKHYVLHNRNEFYQTIEDTYNSDNIYYLVGSDPFLEHVTRLLLNNGHHPRDIEMDKKSDKKEQIFHDFKTSKSKP